MCNQFADFIACHTILKRPFKMERYYVSSIECNQGGERDQAAVALRETGAFPDIAIKNLLGQFKELRCYFSERLPGLGFSHGFLLILCVVRIILTKGPPRSETAFKLYHSDPNSTWQKS